MDGLTKGHKLFHSFEIKPDIRFDSQGEEEKILLLLRGHPVTQIPWIINGCILLFLLGLLNFVFGAYLNTSQTLFLNLFVIIVVIAYYWFNFLMWYFNVGIITTDQVVDVDFGSILYKEVTTADLKKVEDITAKSGGFLASIFDYGNLFIQTAGTEANVEFINIPHASRVAKLLSDIIEKYAHKGP